MRLQVIVGDRNGFKMAEIDAEVSTVAERINKIGKARISISIRDAKLTDEVIRYGNRVLIRFDNGLPDWGGIIDPPRTWKNKVVDITAYDAKWILNYRTTDKGRYFEGASAGYIFRSLIQEANAVDDLDVSLGYVWMGGEAHSTEYHIKSILEICQESICGRLSTAEFNVRAELAGERIRFIADLHEKMGNRLQNIALIDGHNFEEVERIEQGDLVNQWLVAGGGIGWGDERLLVEVNDAISQADYGLRQAGRVLPDVEIYETLVVNAGVLLENSKGVADLFGGWAKNQEPAVYGAYGLGDIIQLELPDHGVNGFKGEARLISREYDADRDEAYLVLEGVS